MDDRQCDATTLIATSTATYEGAVREILQLPFLYPIISVAHYRQINVNDNYKQRLASTEESILKNGMVNPLVVLVTNAQEWEQRLRIMQAGSQDHGEFTKTPNVDGDIYQVLCGCKRLWIAKMAGYTHIDCLVTRSIEKAGEICSAQRKSRKDIDNSCKS